VYSIIDFMCFNNSIINQALNDIARNFARADNAAYPQRKACAVCGNAPGGGAATGFFRPQNLAVVASGAPCPNPARRWNASRNVPATPSGANHWATCAILNNSQGLPVPSLNVVAASGSNPPNSANIWVKIGPVGSII
jgi:hypothetical protein